MLVHLAHLAIEPAVKTKHADGEAGKACHDPVERVLGVNSEDVGPSDEDEQAAKTQSPLWQLESEGLFLGEGVR